MWVNYRKLTMSAQTGYWTSSLWETYINLCCFFDQWELGFNLDCILSVLDWGSSSIDILFDSYWLNHNIQVWCWYCWFLTIIFMVFGTILTLHSSIMSYNANWLICFLFVLVSYAKRIKPYQIKYIAAYIIRVLHRCKQGITCLFCKESDDVWFFLLGLDSFLIYRITHIYVLRLHRNKVHGASFPCAGCSFWVLDFCV